MFTLVLSVLFLLLFVQGVFSLQEVAGPLVISVPIGGSNSAQWGLMNDGNQTITVDLSATGNAANYLSFPTTVNLQPGNIVYVSITAVIPNTSSTGNFTGTLYALQVGNSGQVQMNVQLTKSITIMVSGQSTQQTTTTTATSSTASFVNAGNGNGNNLPLSTTTTTIPATTSPSSTPTQTTTTTPTSSVPTTTTTSPGIFSGFATLFNGLPWYLAIILAVLILGIIFVIYKRKKKKDDSNQIENDEPEHIENDDSNPTENVDSEQTEM